MKKCYSYLIPIAFLGLSLLIRAPGLGKWCISSDEFYFSQPISFIMEKGIPELPGGGYYTRGIILQYLTVLPVKIFSKWEFSIRLIPLIFGTFTVAIFYSFCRLFLPVIPAVVSSTILLLSSWHIEFSRFARFYAPFQFLFFLFLYTFYIGYWQNVRKHQLLSWFIAFISIFVYEGAIFFPLLLFIGSLPNNTFENIKKRNMELYIIIILLLLTNYFVNDYDWWFYQLSNTLPENVKFISTKPLMNIPIYLPDMELFRYVLNNWYLTICWISLLGLAGAIYLKERKKNNSVFIKIAMISGLLFCLSYQYCLLSFVFGILFILRKDIKLYYFDNKMKWIFYVFITMIYWVIIIYISGNINKTLYFLVGYPAIKHSVIIPLLKNVPIWSVIMFTAIIAMTIYFIFTKTSKTAGFVIVIILSLFLTMPLFKTSWKTSRYVYFFFPLFILTLSVMMNSIAEIILSKHNNKNYIKYLMIILITSPFFIFMMTEDFNLYHILDVSSKETNFRMGKYDNLSSQWYPRVDLESPVLYVNKNFKEGDVVILDHVAMSRYIEKPYLNYVYKGDPIRFPYHSRNRGKTEKWTGRPLISSPLEFSSLVPGNNNSLWLVAMEVDGYIGTSFARGHFHTPVEIAQKFNLNINHRYVGVDGRVGVWEFSNSNMKGL